MTSCSGLVQAMDRSCCSAMAELPFCYLGFFPGRRRNVGIDDGIASCGPRLPFHSRPQTCCCQGPDTVLSALMVTPDPYDMFFACDPKLRA
ncbi:hypothetical protein CGRA01v4_08826 [Colletotrichum graminicola]|nr:hypothetical protein CGRA01v4_08826 [Colletotrichum graminicola]